MSFGKQITHRAEATLGRLKQLFGRATHNEHLETEGRGEQAKGHTKQAGENLKDAVKR